MVLPMIALSRRDEGDARRLPAIASNECHCTVAAEPLIGAIADLLGVYIKDGVATVQHLFIDNHGRA
jgi:hypothetical protein